MPNRWLTVMCASMIAWGADSSNALVIDNFEQGPVTVADSGLNDLIPPLFPVPMVVGTQAEQTGLSASNVVGGVRIVSAIATDPAAPLPELPVDPIDLGAPLPIPVPTNLPATSTALLAAPVPGLPDDGIQFASLGGGAFRLVYDGLPGGTMASGRLGELNLDLSGFDHFELTALGVTGAALGAPPQINLTLYDSVTVRSTSFMDVVEGVNIVPIPGLGVLNLSDINQILIDIRGISTGSTFQLTHVEAVAVPEPSAALLVAFGVAALAVRRRSRDRG